MGYVEDDRWDPTGRAHDDLDEIFDLISPRWFGSRAQVWRPPTDVYEVDGKLVVKVEIAGMDESGFRVTLEQRRLVIAGERPMPSGRRTYHQMEIPYGPFRVDVLLPWSVDADSVEAVYESGFLRVTLNRAQPRRVSVRDASTSSSPKE